MSLWSKMKYKGGKRRRVYAWNHHLFYKGKYKKIIIEYTSLLT